MFFYADFMSPRSPALFHQWVSEIVFYFIFLLLSSSSLWPEKLIFRHTLAPISWLMRLCKNLPKLDCHVFCLFYVEKNVTKWASMLHLLFFPPESHELPHGTHYTYSYLPQKVLNSLIGIFIGSTFLKKYFYAGFISLWMNKLQ